MKNIFQGLYRGGLVHEKNTTYFTYESCDESYDMIFEISSI